MNIYKVCLAVVLHMLLINCQGQNKSVFVAKDSVSVVNEPMLKYEKMQTAVLEVYTKEKGYKAPSYQEFKDKCLFLFGVYLNTTPKDYSHDISVQLEYTINEPARLIYTNAESLFYQPEMEKEPTEGNARRMLENKAEGIGDKLVAYNKLLFNDDPTTLAYFINHQEEAIEVVYKLDYEGNSLLTKKAIAFARQTDIYTDEMESILFYKNKERGFRKNFITDIYQQCCIDDKKIEPFEILVDAYCRSFVKLQYRQSIKDECLVFLLKCLMDFDDKHNKNITKITDMKSYQHMSNFMSIDKKLAQRLRDFNFYKNNKLEKLIHDVEIVNHNVEEAVDYYINDPDGFCNMRNRRDISGQIIKKVASGSFVNILEQNGDWWKVKTEDGTIGYIHKSRIKLSD